MPVLDCHINVVKREFHVNATEDLGVPELLGEVSEDREGELVQLGLAVELSKVPTASPASGGLCLQVEGTAPGGGVGDINGFNNPQIN